MLPESGDDQQERHRSDTGDQWQTHRESSRLRTIARTCFRRRASWWCRRAVTDNGSSGFQVHGREWRDERGRAIMARMRASLIATLIGLVAPLSAAAQA